MYFVQKNKFQNYQPKNTVHQTKYSKLRKLHFLSIPKTEYV